MPPAPPKKISAPAKNIRALLLAAQKHSQENRPLEAAKMYFEITRRQPDCFEAFCRLGVILNHLQQFREACACLENAIRLRPDHPNLNLLLGGIFKKLGRFDEAAECCRRELRLQPASADAHYNLGLVLQNLEQLDEAIAAYQGAIELRPGYADALVNLGFVLRQKNETAAALRCFEEAVAREPQNAEARWELCATRLALGDFERGWPEYEWRWKQRDFQQPPSFPQPRWDGTELGGRRIFLHPEQGYGDTIQFARYATLVAQRGGEVIVGCPKALSSLIKTIPGVSGVVTSRAELPQFDVHAPLMSLPAIFRTTVPTVPAAVPYLAVPRTDFAFDQASDPRFKVGIVWAGDPRHKNDRNRSAKLENFLPLAELPGVCCFSLQAGDAARQLEPPPGLGKIINLGGRFRDFADTAQAISQMDLVVSVDTCAAHLAGALGKSVWTLLPFEAEWRWLVGREDSPWYPTMRLFRQSERGNWSQVLARVAAELKAQIAARRKN